jgi:hypothetical protein
MPEHPPAITVSIPTYNRADLLRRALHSVLAQPVPMEVFVCDNASSDTTRDVVEAIADPRVTYLGSPVNRGPRWNLSRCLHVGSAPHLTILCDDDVMLPSHLESKLVFLADNPDAGFVHSAWHRVDMDADGAVLQEIDVWPGGHTGTIESGQHALRQFLTTGIDLRYYFCTAVFRRTVVDDDERFRDEDGTSDDIGLTLRLIKNSRAVGYLADPSVSSTKLAAGLNVASNMAEVVGGQYVDTPVSVRNTLEMKEKFLDEFGGEIPNCQVLRREARELAQLQLISLARLHLVAGSPWSQVFERLGLAARMRPTAMARSETARAVASLGIEGGRRVARSAGRGRAAAASR